MPTSPAIAELPFVTAKRKELAQSRKARIAERSRLEVGEDFLKRHPRCRPIISAVVQHPLRVENHPVYDLGSREHNASHVFQNASHVFSPARVPRWRPQTRRHRRQADSFRFGAGAVASWRATTTRAAPIWEKYDQDDEDAAFAAALPGVAMTARESS